MRYTWFLFLIALLAIFSLTGCSPAATPLTTTDRPDSAATLAPAAPTSTMTPVALSPLSAGATTASADAVLAAPRDEATPVRLTTVPDNTTGTIQEEKMAVGTSVPALTDQAIPDQIQQAKDDLARRLGVDAAQISVLEAREVTWPDSSLGCPEAGVDYEPVARAGWLIRLSVDRQMYFYHSDQTSPPFLCEQTLNLLKGTPKVDEMVPPPDSEID